MGRFWSNFKVAKSFYFAGVALSSLCLYPFRRRSASRWNQLTLRNGFTIFAPPNVELTALFQEIWVNRCYAPLSLLELGAENAIIDIGAHIGVFTIWAAATFPKSRIVSVEPSPDTFAVLSKNCRENLLSGVDLVQSACGATTGVAQIYSRGPASMNTLYGRDYLQSSFQPAYIAPVISLDDLLVRLHIDCPCLLKLDCEGAEYEILMNASDAALRRLKYIVMEYHLGMNTKSPQQLVDFLQKKGFETTIFPQRSREDGYLHARPLPIESA